MRNFWDVITWSEHFPVIVQTPQSLPVYWQCPTSPLVWRTTEQGVPERNESPEHASCIPLPSYVVLRLRKTRLWSETHPPDWSLSLSPEYNANNSWSFIEFSQCQYFHKVDSKKQDQFTNCYQFQNLKHIIISLLKCFTNLRIKFPRDWN